MNALATVHAADYAVSDIERMAQAVAKSRLFGMKEPEQALALMLIAQAEGMHPAIAARDYHVIQGRPTLKADAMLARFQQAGGKVSWGEYTAERVAATFSHPQGGSVEIDWTIAQAKAAGLANKDTWKQYPRQMLRARVISEGIRTVFPGVAVGVYTPEEADDFDAKPARQPAQETARVVEEEPEGPSPIFTACKAAIDICDDEAALNAWKEQNAKAFEQMNDDDYNAVGAYWRDRVKAARAAAKAAPPTPPPPDEDFGIGDDEIPF